MLMTNDNGIDRPMTEKEIAEHKKQAAITKKELDAVANADAARTAALASAHTKLAALGLTEEEVKAIVGGI